MNEEKKCDICGNQAEYIHEEIENVYNLNEDIIHEEKTVTQYCNECIIEKGIL